MDLSNSIKTHGLNYIIDSINCNALFIGTSNYKLDQDIMNHTMTLALNEYEEIEDLQDISIQIAESFDLELSLKYKFFYEI